MNLVIGLDVSKGQSEGQAFLSKGKPYGRSFRFFHTLEGFKDLLNMIHEVRSKASGSSPVVILDQRGIIIKQLYSVLNRTRSCFWWSIRDCKIFCLNSPIYQLD